MIGLNFPVVRLFLLLFLIGSTAAAQAIRFDEVAAESGVDFRFDNGARGKRDLPEIMGGGVALFDADGDGRLDLFFCNGGPIVPGEGRDDPPCRLFRNRGDGRFEDVTSTAGAPGPSYAMGAAAADYDGDGRIDLFVSGWRDQRLYRNLGGGRFEDVTQRVGLASTAWTTGAAWADLDGDGDLDLYVAAYVDYDPATAPFCAAPDGKRDYCGPEDFPAQPDRLYRNNGDGTFTDVSAAAGFPARPERGLGVLIADLTGDRRPDVFVANDGGRCRLLANRGDLRFEEIGVESGVALDRAGNPLAGMGTALADLDGDGLSDLVVTNFLDRSTIGFRAVAGGPTGLFEDDSERLGLVAATREVLGFGLIAADFDADGRIDLLQTNGHVLERSRLNVPFEMRPILLRGLPGGLEPASRDAGAWFSRPILGRGLAVGDIDGDGRPDILAGALDAPAAILLNRSPGGGHRLRLELIDAHGRPAIGARVRAEAGGRVIVADLIGGGSYLSSSPPTLTLGLDAASRVDRLDIHWPWGAIETRRDLDAAKPIRLVEPGHGVGSQWEDNTLPPSRRHSSARGLGLSQRRRQSSFSPREKVAVGRMRVVGFTEGAGNSKETSSSPRNSTTLTRPFGPPSPGGRGKFTPGPSHMQVVPNSIGLRPRSPRIIPFASRISAPRR